MDPQAATPAPLNTYRRTEIKGYEPLVELALNLRWSWSHYADRIWHQLDPVLWEITHNPWVVLQTVSREQLEAKLSDPEFIKNVSSLVQENRREAISPGWFQQTYPKTPLKHIAYFSMEYMLTEGLPIYSGGLGNVAGDQLKSASDLGVPVSAIGLLYQKGYFRQTIDKDGNQQALYPYNDPGQLPITPLRKANGEWLRIEITLPGYSLWLRTWQVQVGRVKLYLLDSNDAANFPAHRGITSELYGGGPELRLQQELLLGIGGWRLLQAIGIEPEVCHLNEGHAAFAILERARTYMEKTGQPFAAALAATRAGNLFTTHTAVAAGFDRFSPSLISQYLETYSQNQLGISLNDLLALGRRNPDDANEPFNMAYLAIHGSGSANGVSRLHGQVSRHIFEDIFPHWPEEEVPIGYVTNGVHMPSWDSAAADELWTQSCGKCRWLQPTENLEADIRKIPETSIWKMRNSERGNLVTFARTRLARQLAVRGAPSSEVEQAKELFDPHTLTLGFARRFATYKRPDMLLKDPERLLRILTNPRRPVQLIIAGKAHPADLPGQALIREWMDFIKRPEVRPHVIFLSDYDMHITEGLVRGVDVWINTPRRPWEACGTSGMKVLVNGGLNLSELDGWWAEAYTPSVGWALGDGKEHDSNPAWDTMEASALYDLLENQVIPEFYTRDAEGLPTAWIRRIRESMARLTPQYSANRAVREYTEKHYLPAANAYTARTADKSWAGKVISWKKNLTDHWSRLRFGEMKVETKGKQHEFEVQLYLDDLDPAAVQVELYADGLNGAPPECCTLTRSRALTNADATYAYTGSISAERPAAHYTPRVIPFYPGVAVPLEASQILWLR